MNTPTEPEWWRINKEVITIIKVLNNAWKPWPVNLEHNGKKYPIPEKWLRIHINGWALRIHWVPINVQKNVQRWVENVFRHNSWTGRIEKVETIDSNNIPLTHYEWSQE